jgi:7-cyano-7-deazaguanine reductase
MTFPVIEIWENQNPQRDFIISIMIEEFTSVCPKTGLPDFGTITIDYIPDQTCVELKAFKYYMLAYRQVGIFYENVVNRILTDFVAACQPRQVTVKGVFSARGGIKTDVSVRYTRPGYTPTLDNTH